MWNHYFLIIFFPPLTPQAGNLDLSNQEYKRVSSGNILYSLITPNPPRFLPGPPESDLISYWFQEILDQTQITIIMFTTTRLLIYFFTNKVFKKHIQKLILT